MAIEMIGRKLQDKWKSLLVAVPFFWLLIFFLIPFVIVFKISLAESMIASPPFSSLLTWGEEGSLQIRLLSENYAYLFEDDLYIRAYANSVKVALISTVVCLLIGYPMAYGIARANPTRRKILLILIILPFWTSFLLRVYAWMGILADQGTLNNFLIWLGVIDEPIRMLYTQFAFY